MRGIDTAASTVAGGLVTAALYSSALIQRCEGQGCRKAITDRRRSLIMFLKSLISTQQRGARVSGGAFARKKLAPATKETPVNPKVQQAADYAQTAAATTMRVRRCTVASLLLACCAPASPLAAPPLRVLMTACLSLPGPAQLTKKAVEHLHVAVATAAKKAAPVFGRVLRVDGQNGNGNFKKVPWDPSGAHGCILAEDLRS